MTKEIEEIINQVDINWSKDHIIRFLYIRLAPFFQKDLSYFLASEEEKYRQYQLGFINNGTHIVCSTLADFYVDIFRLFHIKAKKIAANSAKIPLFALIVEGNNGWYFIDPINDLFRNQYGLQPTEYGVIPFYNTLRTNYPYLISLSKAYINSLDKDLQLPMTFDTFFDQLHLEMTNRNFISDFFDIKSKNNKEIFVKKMDFVDRNLLNLGNVPGIYERIQMYFYLERMIFFRFEKKFLTIKIEDFNGTLLPFLQYADSQDKESIQYIETKENDIFRLQRLH